MVGIYIITNPKGKVYVGQSVDVFSRFKRYKKYISEIKNQTKIYNSITKYGVQNHTFDIIEECSISDLNRLERKYQEYYNSVEEGLNCKYTTTEDKSGHLSNETKKRISDANKGRKFSKEWKHKISKSLTGRKKSIDAEKKRVESRKGYKHSKETLQKIKLSNKSIPSVTCPHCGKVGKPHGMKRWHFDSCKSKRQ